MSKVVAVRHAEDGSIAKYKTDDGQIYDRDEVVKMADSGQIEGIASFTTRDGSMSVRSNRGQIGYSLEELPEF